jgi:hypothetical protein
MKVGSIQVAEAMLEGVEVFVGWNDIAQNIAAVMQVAAPSLMCARFRHVYNIDPRSHVGRALITLEQSLCWIRNSWTVVRCADVLDRVIGSQPLFSGGYSHRITVHFFQRSVRETQFGSRVNLDNYQPEKLCAGTSSKPSANR